MEGAHPPILFLGILGLPIAWHWEGWGGAITVFFGVVSLVKELIRWGTAQETPHLVRKKNWINLGGKPENNETQEETLFREVKEEIGCSIKILNKIGDFYDNAVFDNNKKVKLSVYLVKIIGEPKYWIKNFEKYHI